MRDKRTPKDVCGEARSKVHCTNKALHNESQKKRDSSLGYACNVREEYDSLYQKKEMTGGKTFTPCVARTIIFQRKNLIH